MKYLIKTLVCFILVLTSISAKGQDNNSIPNDSIKTEKTDSVNKNHDVFDDDTGEIGPSFPGGDTALMRYLMSNIQYPQEARKSKASGTVLVKFVIDKDGSVVDAEVIRSVHPAIDKEALRVVSSMPKWKPGYQRGKPVRCRFSIPLHFTYQKK